MHSITTVPRYYHAILWEYCQFTDPYEVLPMNTALCSCRSWLMTCVLLGNMGNCLLCASTLTGACPALGNSMPGFLSRRKKGEPGLNLFAGGGSGSWGMICRRRAALWIRLTHREGLIKKERRKTDNRGVSRCSCLHHPCAHVALLAARTDDVAAPHGASLTIVFMFIFLYHDMCLLMWLRIFFKDFMTLFEEKSLIL